MMDGFLQYGSILMPSMSWMFFLKLTSITRDKDEGKVWPHRLNVTK